MATSMRGLTQFIADIRGARVRELEEKRINKEMANIRKKFKDGNLDGYQKKKYVAKIIFTYILGYKVDVGHMEAVNLISSSKYSEKQIGYLAVTLLMHENSDFLRLVVNSIRKDLDSNSEIDNCLALHAIANVGGSEMADALVEDVHRLLISPTSQNFVKKKAALTLLRLYRKHPDVFPVSDWALRIVSLLDDPDLGVVICVTSLVMAMAQDNLDAFAACYTKVVDRLHRIVIDGEYTSTYAYYKVPSPWLQVKFLRLLQYYPPPSDPTVRNVLQKVLHTIMQNSGETTRNVQHNNAQHAVLFEAISLAIHLDTNSPLVHTAASLLAQFISSRETNVRYLGLDAMAHLAARADSLEPIKMQQKTIILSLRDKDISVRRRALDLLYSMCDTDNSEVIVGELLRYIRVADYALREEMVLKIAILTEKYANSYKWYVDTILQLLSTAGDHVGDEVWYRVVQIVTNTPDLQVYAAKAVFEHLRAPNTHESLVKVGGYILGEYGHLIANDPGYSPSDQFQLLHSKSQFCVAGTRALLLSTYIKWVNVFPEIKAQLVVVFERYRHVMDAELQQRACEFYALARRPEEDEVLQNVCEEMPPFPPRVSALLDRLNKKAGDTEDKRTWVHGGKEANIDRRAVAAAPAPQQNGNGHADTSNIMNALAGLDISSPADSSASVGSPSTMSPFGSLPQRRGPEPTVGGNIDRWFERLLHTTDGVLYEDVQIQLGIKSKYQGYQGSLAVYIGNKLDVPITSVTTTLWVPPGPNTAPTSILEDPSATSDSNAPLSVTFTKMPPSSVAARQQTQVVLNVECRRFFAAALPNKCTPVISLSFMAGGAMQSLALRLPIVVTKFIEPVYMGAQDFFERWKLIGGPPREVQRIFKIGLTKAGELDRDRYHSVVSGCGIDILRDVDPNLSNLVGAGVLHTRDEGKVGCLLRLEPNREAQQCRLTVRSTSEEVANEVQKLVQRPIRV
ncbi:Adaptor protein complex AP-2 alpha subunit [Fistulina hepatica ATCC 64428]|uniref:AP-2 complex subunit alpha n=1 Tax=Fistulina hepatica ATCC 64428 TaxID=1128425 RepID=A0A0D7AME2_9AGAR|nr:Adaptor protein complex AP-2 alpha subunit [Fistulina hepatica ATCC 64428]